jgi:hypothetical protein
MFDIRLKTQLQSIIAKSLTNSQMQSNAYKSHNMYDLKI